MRIKPQSLIARSRAARTLDRLDQFSKPFLLRIFNLLVSAKWRVGTADQERPFCTRRTPKPEVSPQDAVQRSDGQYTPGVSFAISFQRIRAASPQIRDSPLGWRLRTPSSFFR